MVRICTKIRLQSMKKPQLYRAFFGNGISGNQYLIGIVKSQGKYDFLLGANISHPFITFCLGFYILSFFYRRRTTAWTSWSAPTPTTRLYPKSNRTLPQCKQSEDCFVLSSLLIFLRHQSRQSVRISIQSCELAPRVPHPRVLPPPFGSKGGHTRQGERGRGQPIRTKGQTLWYNPSTPPSVTYTETLFLNF